MIESKHFKKRLKTRLHINKKSHDRFINNATRDGLYLDDIRCKSSLYAYMKDLIKDGYYGVIYGRHILILSNDSDICITILNLPKEYYNMVDNIKSKLKGDLIL